MAMSRFEKLFVNRPGKGSRNFDKVSQHLSALDISAVQDVLELGGGIGTASALLAEEFGFRVVGTDFDPKQIAEAKKRYPEGPNLSFQIEDGSKLSFAEDSFDLVVAYNVFHHIPDWQQACQEVVRVLRPGGYFLWLDLVFLRPLRSIFSKLSENESFFTIDEVESNFAAAGLNIISHDKVNMLLFKQHHLVSEQVVEKE